MEDARILMLFLERDERAIGLAVEKYGNYLKTVAGNILKNDCDAEECLNDACFRAWNAIPPAKPQNLRAYLAKITRNLALNMLEKKTAEKRGGEAALIMAELDECTVGSSDTEAAIEGRALEDSLNAFLMSLPKYKRIVFMRRYWYSDTIQKIAEDAGKSEAAIAMELARIRKKLKKHLLERGHEL